MKKVFINGSFDILHPGHINLFSYASLFGDELHVAIDSDERIKKAKGETRPFNNLKDRLLMLNAIRYISYVYSFNTTEELENLIKTIKPDIMVIGSDWESKKVIGSEYAKELKFFPRIEKYSTTKILNYLK